jgi:hypothetical protein
MKLSNLIPSLNAKAAKANIDASATPTTHYGRFALAIRGDSKESAERAFRYVQAYVARIPGHAIDFAGWEKGYLFVAIVDQGE